MKSPFRGAKRNSVTTGYDNDSLVRERERRNRRQGGLRYKLQQRQIADFYYLIDIVGTCNLSCPSCPVGNYDQVPARGVMPLETYELILDKIGREHPSDRIFVDLYNWSEPTLHRQLGEFISATKARNWGVGISSNLNLVRNLRAAVQADPDYIRISLSGYFNDTYQQTHRNGDVNVVKANMHLLRHWIDTFGLNTIVEVGFHIYRENFPDDFTKMRVLCEDLDFIFAPTLATLMPAEKAVVEIDGRSAAKDLQLIESLVLSVKERAELLAHVRKDYPDCQYRSKRTTINFDGSVPLCCATYENEQIIAENFLEITRDELQDRKYQHDFCSQCQLRSLDLIYTNAEPQLAEAHAVSRLGSVWVDFLKDFHSPHEPSVAWAGSHLKIQESYDEAVRLQSAGDLGLAKQLLEALLVEAPRHGDAHLRLGGLLEMDGLWQEALLHYVSAVEVWPGHRPYLEAVQRLEARGEAGMT